MATPSKLKPGLDLYHATSEARMVATVTTLIVSGPILALLLREAVGESFEDSGAPKRCLSDPDAGDIGRRIVENIDKQRVDRSPVAVLRRCTPAALPRRAFRESGGEVLTCFSIVPSPPV